MVSFLTGEPEYLDPLKDETPDGWIVTGYPWYDIKTPEHDASSKPIRTSINDYPRLGSVVGYSLIKAVAAIMTQGRLDRHGQADRRRRGRRRSTRRSARSTFRAIDHQSTLGAFVGKTALKDGKGVMVDSPIVDGADCLPSDAEVKKLRPAELIAPHAAADFAVRDAARIGSLHLAELE